MSSVRLDRILAVVFLGSNRTGSEDEGEEEAHWGVLTPGGSFNSMHTLDITLDSFKQQNRAYNH